MLPFRLFRVIKSCVCLSLLFLNLVSSSSTCYPPVEGNLDRSCEYCPAGPQQERSVDGDLTHISFFLYEGSVHEYAQVFWVDPLGNEKAEFEVPRGSRRERQTFEGNLFRVWDPKHEILLVEHRAGSYPVRYPNLACDASPGPPAHRRLDNVKADAAPPNPADMEHFYPISVVNRGGCSTVGFNWRQMHPRAQDNLEVYKFSLDYGKPVRTLVEQNHKFIVRIGGQKVWEQVIEDIEIPDCAGSRMGEMEKVGAKTGGRLPSTTGLPLDVRGSNENMESQEVRDPYGNLELKNEEAMYFPDAETNGSVFIRFHGPQYAKNAL